MKLWIINYLLKRRTVSPTSLRNAASINVIFIKHKNFDIVCCLINCVLIIPMILTQSRRNCFIFRALRSLEIYPPKLSSYTHIHTHTHTQAEKYKVINKSFSIINIYYISIKANGEMEWKYELKKKQCKISD